MGGNPFARYLSLQMLLHTLSNVVPLAQGLGGRPAQTGTDAATFNSGDALVGHRDVE